MTPSEPVRICVRCGVAFETAVVPCPNIEPFEHGGVLTVCSVLHYGERCPQCGGNVWEARE
jgi:hypothetical protein